MNRIKRINIFFLAMLIMQVLGSYIIGFFVRDILNLSPQQIRTPEVLLAILGSNQIIFVFIPVMIYIIITKQSIKEVLKLNKIHIMDLFLSFLTAILFLPSMMVLSAITQLFSKNDVAEMLTVTGQAPVWVLILVIAVFPAIFEEFTMRGLILSEYRSVSIKKAAIMNGILFSMLHMNIQQSLYTLAMGILVSYLVYYTKSIFASMIFHFTINGVNVLISTIVASGASSEANSAAQSNVPHSFIIIGMIIGFVILLAIAIGTFALIILIIKNIKKRNINKWKEPEKSQDNQGFMFNIENYEIEENMEREAVEESKFKEFFKDVFNIPFVLSIITYIAALTFLK